MENQPQPKRCVILCVMVGLLLSLTAISFFFWPISNATKEKIGININSVNTTTNQLVTDKAPEVIELNSNVDRIHRCIYPFAAYRLSYDMVDGGNSLYSSKGDLLCQTGGIDPSFERGDCPLFQLCFPIYDQ